MTNQEKTEALLLKEVKESCKRMGFTLDNENTQDYLLARLIVTIEDAKSTLLATSAIGSAPGLISLMLQRHTERKTMCAACRAKAQEKEE